MPVLAAKKMRPAFSVRQPFAEQILRGIKQFEYRTVPTRMRRRVYVYASSTIQPDQTEWAKLGGDVDAVLRGRVIGTVEVVGCDWCNKLSCYRWHLARPRRIAARRPRNHPQPVWFYPFDR